MSAHLDQLDSEIASLAAQISAATHTLLCKIREFDACDGFAAQGFLSTAHYLNFRIGLTLSAAREKVRVARALADLPLIDAAFSAGSISYSKVRALTRIATPKNEDSLLTIANETTASQLEKLVRGCQREDDSDAAAAREATRYLSCQYDGEGMLVIQGCLLPEEGALLMKALEVMRTPKEPMARQKRLADALVLVAQAALDHACGAETENRTSADRCQIIVHVDAEVLSEEGDETGRADVGGVGVSAEVARRLACDASVITMTHDRDGKVVDVGRKTRTISTPLRRKLVERDGGCRFPGCGNVFVDGHHVKHWSAGGETTLSNLASLCKKHHRMVHEHGFSLSSDQSGGLMFRKPNGEPIPHQPAPLAARTPLKQSAATEMGLWRGHTIDYGYVVSNMLGR